MISSKLKALVLDLFAVQVFFLGLWVALTVKPPAVNVVRIRSGIGRAYYLDEVFTNPAVVSVRWETNVGWGGFAYVGIVETNYPWGKP